MHSFNSNRRPARDSRVTSTSRRSSATGYLAKPCVDSRLLARLPIFEIQSHRIVQIGEEAWELWSPNSLQIPFLPGRVEDFMEISIASRRPDRRSDGHLGRFDACVSPQYSTGHSPWAPHVRRVPSNTLACPEFANILDVTDMRGSINPRYVEELLQRNSAFEGRITELMAISQSNSAIAFEDEWRRSRPFISQEDIEDLRSIRSFDRALDDVTHLQRKFKMKAAWIDWMEQLQSTPSWSRSSNRPPDMADDSYMGTWINDAWEEDVEWFLAHRIPCFVVHKLMGEELNLLFDAGHGGRVTSFITGTPIENLSHPHNRIEAFLRRQNVIITHSDDDDNIGKEEPSEPSDPAVARAASFSLSHRAWSRGGPAPVAYSVTAPIPSGPGTSTSASTRPSPLLQIDFAGWEAEPLDLVEINPSRVSWIRPPPVTRPLERQKWEKWAEKNVNGQLFVSKVGKAYSNMDSASYFDRARNREIILLEEVPMLPGIVSEPEVFGFPCPRHLQFVEEPQNKAPRPAKSSYWLYTTMNPVSGNVGLQPMRPDASSLPLKDEFRTGGSDRPPSPPSSPGHPALPDPLPFVSFDSPPSRGIPYSERPISPTDSLLASPRAVNWDSEFNEPMGPQIPAISMEDVEMGTVDLGDVPSPSSAPLSSLPRQLSREITPDQRSTPRHSPPRAPPRSSAPKSAPRTQRQRSPPRPSRQSPPRRGPRKHARTRSRTPSPPRRRGDSYRPRAPAGSLGGDRHNPRPPAPAANAWPTPSGTSNPWESTPTPLSWSTPNPLPSGPTPPSWGPPPGYMPWGFGPPTQNPWSIHYPGYYPSEQIPLPNWPPMSYPPMQPHHCPSCNNCASCGRPSLPAAGQDPHQPPPTTSSSSLLGRLRSPSNTDRPHTTAVPLAQRLRDPAPLIDRMAPPASLSQRLQSPSPEFVQGTSSRPFQSNSTRSLHQRLANEEEEGELSDREENVPTSRARRSRRAGRKQKEEDEQRIKEGKQPAPGKGKRRDRRDRGSRGGFA